MSYDGSTLSKGLIPIKNCIIDTEVHLLHPEAREQDYLSLGNEPTRRVIHEHHEFSVVKDLCSPEALLDSMTKSGIDHSIIMGLSWLDEGAQNENNEYVQDCVERWPERFSGMYIPHLGDVNKAAREVDEMPLHIFKGIKLLPSCQGVLIDDPRLAPLVEVARSKKLPLMVHTDHITQGLDRDSPFRLFSFLQQNPDITVLAPHLGGLLCLYALHEQNREYLDSVVFITSVSSTMKFVKFAAEVNPLNLMFGSDYPFNHSHSQEQCLRELQALCLPEEELAAIEGGTACKIFGFSGFAEGSE